MVIRDPSDRTLFNFQRTLMRRDGTWAFQNRKSGDAAVVLKQIVKQYSPGSPAAVDNISLQFDSGCLTTLLGPSGCGKTTTFYAIAGLITPEAGQVLIDGRDVTALPMYRRARLGIGYLPQEMSIFRGLSVEDNILAVLEIAEPDRQNGHAWLLG